MTEPQAAQDRAQPSQDAGGAGRKFYGKYRGTVINNVDPMQMGRIQAMVPDVSAFLPTSWCIPCMPASGIQAGMLAVPAMGAGVWIEFEQGDPDYPIWAGCWWGSAAELPVLSHLAPPGTVSFTLQTMLQNGLLISDLPGPTGGIMLKSATGAAIIVNDTGIYLSNGKGATITLVGPTVAINTAALVIT
jgi:type VI secretion system (T6SS) baseplate-like injector VgrG